VVRHRSTSAAAVALAVGLAERMGKTPIVVADSPGFASSRLGLALGLEAMRMVEQGVASAADIDTAMKLGYGHPMGPLELTDLVGLDVRLGIAEYLEDAVGPAFAAPDLLRRKVQDGKLGKKTGEGFYRWSSDGKKR
jgi:3-hydroxybutyryl-CoA dehydrogenase